MNNNNILKEAPPRRETRFGIALQRKTPIRIICLLAACSFIIYGFARGEAGVVLNKAVNICLECIGLG